MNRKPPPKLEQVLALYNYDEDTGLFRHKRGTGRGKTGSIAGSIRKDGAVTLKVDDTIYYGHHLAWLIKYNEWPLRLDHENLNRSDNSIKNLRKANASQNGANHFGWKKKELPRGVSWSKAKEKYIAQIKVNYKGKHLGYFDTVTEATQAYKEAAIQHFGEFAK